METFVGDTIKINLSTGIDLSGYDILHIKFRRPDGTFGRWIAAVDAVITHMVYTTKPTDLDMPGKWTVQAHVEDAALPETDLHGEFVEFDVLTPFIEAHSTPAPTTLGPTTEWP